MGAVFVPARATALAEQTAIVERREPSIVTLSFAAADFGGECALVISLQQRHAATFGAFATLFKCQGLNFPLQRYEPRTIV
jgi:hypothetical protein